MKNKIVGIVALGVIFALLSFCPLPGIAGDEGCECGKKPCECQAMPPQGMRGSHDRPCGMGQKGGWSLEKNFKCKLNMVLSQEEELGLTAEQVTALKQLRLNTMKALIRQEAEIEVAALEIKMLMWEESVDVAAVSALIDRKFEVKKEMAKGLVQAYATLTGVLSPEQKAKLIESYKNCPFSRECGK